MHKGIDIQAQDGTPVYAMQPGTARVLAAGTADERVQVGSYLYWHIHHRVRTGQFVSAYRTVVGTILNGAGHLHLSELSGERFLNPLRPGGRVLSPWTDTQAPIIGSPTVAPGGRVERRGVRPAVVPRPDQVPHARPGSGGARLPRMGRRAGAT